MNSLYRTMLFVPGNAPAKLTKAEIYGADCVIFDLEDAVSVQEKDAARDLVRTFLSTYHLDCRVGIRVNAQDTPYYEEDVKAMVPLKPDNALIKCLIPFMSRPVRDMCAALRVCLISSRMWSVYLKISS